MGSIIEIVRDCLTPFEWEVAIIGRSGAGKTTMMYRLKFPNHGLVDQRQTSMMESIVYKGINFSFWDLSARGRAKEMMRHYMDKDLVIFVIRTDFQERIEEDKDLIKAAMENSLNEDRLCIVLINLSQGEGSRIAHYREELQQLNTDNQWDFLECCAVTGEGLNKVIDSIWHKAIASKPKLKVKNRT